MDINEAEEIIRLYDKYESVSCSCHCGHPPCSKCVDCPSKKDYQEALRIIEEFENGT